MSLGIEGLSMGDDARAALSGGSRAASLEATAFPSLKLAPERPRWLINALAEQQLHYPQERLEVVLRWDSQGSTPQWQIRCLDCPGKLYCPGPGETLENFQVHSKNRRHNKMVHERVEKEARKVAAQRRMILAGL